MCEEAEELKEEDIATYVRHCSVYSRALLFFVTGGRSKRM